MPRLVRTAPRSIVTLLLTLTLLAPAALPGPAWSRTRPPAAPLPPAIATDAQAVRMGAAVGAPSKALADTFYLYGGPGSLLGKFETGTLLPDRQGWIGVDLTEAFPRWHVDTFNAANLGGAPPYWSGPYAPPATNHAMWDGVPAGTPGYAAAPGYGNLWNEGLDRWFTVANPALATTLNWDFVFNHDTEPNFDFFTVQWDSAGTMVALAAFDGSNRDINDQFTTPATFGSVLVVSPSAYVGGASNQIHLRLLFESDGGWSDEDGEFDGDGAVQVDNIQVNGNNGVGLSQATFEDGADGGWVLAKDDVFAGDFSKVFAALGDVDPCVDNDTPQMTFIDDGTPPANDPLGRTTGGSISVTWGYGSPERWVVNFTGGLSDGLELLDNEVWSPEIAWDLPGPADDPAAGGAFLRFTIWEHLPLSQGMYWRWHVRSFPDPETGGWSSWRDRGLIYASERPHYGSWQLEVGDLLVPQPTKVQVALGVIDLKDVIFFPVYDATTSPTFDDVAFAKYLPDGPTIVAREIDLFQDGFPNSGQTEYSAATAADLVVRVDIARNIRPAASPGSMPGDSLIADVTPTVPGTTLAGNPTLHWFLAANSAFDNIRVLPPDAVAIAPGQWVGTVTGDTVRTSGGTPVPNRFSFDLPDGPAIAPYQSDEPPFFFPGDLLRYYLRAEDSGGHVSLLPADTTDFLRAVVALPKTTSVCPRQPSRYDAAFEINALPSIWVSYTIVKDLPAGTAAPGDTVIVQPPILIWNDLGPGPWLDQMELAFSQNGLWRADAYDVYTTWAPSSGASNGLGAAGRHGATPAQLAGYSCLLYESGALASYLISDGSGTGGNDRSNDVGALNGWLGQPAPRYAAYFGDNIGAGQKGAAVAYRDNVMGVQFVATDVSSAIGNQTAPRVGPTVDGSGLGFGTQFVAFGGCPDVNQFDQLLPRSPAVRAHEFLTPSGAGGAYVPAASVYYAKQDTIAAQPYDRAHVTFPYGFVYVRDVIGEPPAPGGRSARANLLRELLLAFGHGALLDDNPVDAGPSRPRALALSPNRPNPFNPSTTFELVAPERGQVSVRIYSVRGQHIATLLDGVVDAGPRTLQWDGRDAAGGAVASGVYLVEARGFGQSQMRKMALIR